MSKATGLLLLLPIILFFSSCKTAQIAASGRKSNISLDTLLLEMDKRWQYDWLSARIRVNYADRSQQKSFTANVRMRRDSVLWISVTSIMGVEVARLLMKEDSVFFIDRLNKKFQAGHFSMLSKYFPFPFEILQLQRIVTGEMISVLSERPVLKTEKESFILMSENNKTSQTVRISRSNLTISTQYLLDKQNDRSVSLVFDDYRTEDGRLFSFSRNISASDTNEITLSLKFSKVKWDEPQTFPFHVSDNYEEY